MGKVTAIVALVAVALVLPTVMVIGGIVLLGDGNDWGWSLVVGGVVVFGLVLRGG